MTVRLLPATPKTKTCSDTVRAVFSNSKNPRNTSAMISLVAASPSPVLDTDLTACKALSCKCDLMLHRQLQQTWWAVKKASVVFGRVLLQVFPNADESTSTTCELHPPITIRLTSGVPNRSLSPESPSESVATASDQWCFCAPEYVSLETLQRGSLALPFGLRYHDDLCAQL